jgi:CTP-dependent riboflavin kinase
MSDAAPPPVSFLAYVSGLVMAAAMYLGDQPDPVTGTVSVNLTSAGHAIDVLVMLQQKTQGNLTIEERQFLDQAVYELRVKYVEAAQKGPSRLIRP